MPPVSEPAKDDACANGRPIRIILLLSAMASLSACATPPAGAAGAGDPPPRQRTLSQEKAAIARLRAGNNRAMAARDLDATMAIVGTDYVIVAGNSSIVRSAEDMRLRWSRTFGDPDRQACVRTPAKIEVGGNAGVLRAAERGRWRCPTTTPKGQAIQFGSYFAHWRKDAERWVVISDTYVTLGCAGSGCVR